MSTVLLATFNLLPAGEPGGELLVSALAERGHRALWVRWDDPEVDWAGADLVAARSTWDYHRRCPEFLAWAARVEQQTPLLNGAAAFAWNADKAYLLELGKHVPIVPTALLDDTGLVPGLGAALQLWGRAVVKPRTGASGIGVLVVDHVSDGQLQGLVAGPWVVQPLVESVRTRGELSVYVFDGRAVTQVDKAPAGGDSRDIRVHELYGGSTRSVALEPEAAAVAEQATAAAALLLGELPAYARVDLMLHDGALVVGELELIEPGLYLDLVPANADAFAEMVAARL